MPRSVFDLPNSDITIFINYAVNDARCYKFYNGMLALPAVPAVSGAHDLVSVAFARSSRLSGICCPRVPSVCPCKGAFWQSIPR